MKTFAALPFDQAVTEKSDDELLAILAQPDDWQAEMQYAAKRELQRRGFEFFAASEQPAIDSEFDELQRVADYRILRKDLRLRGIGSIVWGLIAIGLGVATMDVDRANLVLAAIGGFLVIEGVWVVAAPAPVGMIFDGCALLILGVWNIAITVKAMSAGNDAMPMFIVLGAVQLGWAGQSFAKYARFRRLSMTAPSAQTLQRFDQIASHMHEATMASDASLVEFVTNNPLLTWKGRLGKAGAIFVNQRNRKHGGARQGARKDPAFASKQDVLFRRNGDGMMPNTLKMTFSLKGRKVAGSLSQEALRRYESWKTGIKHLGAPDPQS